MITQLTIRNFGLIDNASVEFGKGLNILTGETGAGKSILIDGLRFGLGEKLNTAAVRDPALPCVVQIVADVSRGLIDEYPPLGELVSEENTLIIDRIYLPDGKSKVKINGLTVTISQLKDIGDHLIDFHGPHDHQMLLSTAAHREILDRLCGINDENDRYAPVFKRFSDLKKELNALAELSQNRQRDIELLEHQIQELSQVPLDEIHFNNVVEKQTKINNSEKLFESGRQILQALDHEDSSIATNLAAAFTCMRSLNKTDPGTVRFAETLTTLQEASNRLTAELRDYLDSLSFEPQEAAKINRERDIYDDIKRKYGPDLDNAAKYLSEIREKREKLANIEENTRNIEDQISAAEKELGKAADSLTKLRKKTAGSLTGTIEKELKELGILHVQFECRIEKTGFNEYGQDDIAFYISPNAGEDLKPLAEIVSSGEAARAMLALKKALIDVDPIPVLIFDEIDAQIGGRLGTITGRKLKELSANRQVILITHLPQIASFADIHFKISKKVSNNRTVTCVEQLDQEGTVRELAKMMSGENETSIALTHAREMLNTAGCKHKKIIPKETNKRH